MRLQCFNCGYWAGFKQFAKQERWLRVCRTVLEVRQMDATHCEKMGSLASCVWRGETGVWCIVLSTQIVEGLIGERLWPDTFWCLHLTGFDGGVVGRVLRPLGQACVSSLFHWRLTTYLKMDARAAGLHSSDESSAMREELGVQR